MKGGKEDIRETDADHRAGIRGHHVLQRDEPVYAEGEDKSKHPMVIILYSAQFEQMQGVNRGKLWDIGRKVRGKVVLQRLINTKTNRNN
jgi:hypothetical protein